MCCWVPVLFTIFSFKTSLTIKSSHSFPILKNSKTAEKKHRIPRDVVQPGIIAGHCVPLIFLFISGRHFIERFRILSLMSHIFLFIDYNLFLGVRREIVMFPVLEIVLFTIYFYPFVPFIKFAFFNFIY